MRMIAMLGSRATTPTQPLVPGLCDLVARFPHDFDRADALAIDNDRHIAGFNGGAISAANHHGAASAAVGARRTDVTASEAPGASFTTIRT